MLSWSPPISDTFVAQLVSSWSNPSTMSFQTSTANAPVVDADALSVTKISTDEPTVTEILAPEVYPDVS